MPYVVTTKGGYVTPDSYNKNAAAVFGLDATKSYGTSAIARLISNTGSYVTSATYDDYQNTLSAPTQPYVVYDFNTEIDTEYAG